MLTKDRFNRALTWSKGLDLAEMPPSYSTPLGAMFLGCGLDILKKLPPEVKILTDRWVKVDGEWYLNVNGPTE